jgi:F0F1-type ATP synthase assembly protein I
VVPRTEKTSELWAQALYYASLSFIIPGSSLAGYLAGWYLDRYLATGPILAIVGGFAGAGTGIAEVLQLITRAEKNAAKRNQRDGGRRG